MRVEMVLERSRYALNNFVPILTIYRDLNMPSTDPIGLIGNRSAIPLGGYGFHRWRQSF
jgi:hypothetical protein